MVPQFPNGKHSVNSFPAAESLSKAIEKVIEVIIVNNKNAIIWMRAIELLKLFGDLQPHRRFARSLFTKNDRCRWLVWIAIDLVPRWMKRAVDAMVFEDRIALRIFVGKWVATNVVMIEKLLDFHGTRRESLSVADDISLIDETIRSASLDTRINGPARGPQLIIAGQRPIGRLVFSLFLCRNLQAIDNPSKQTLVGGNEFSRTVELDVVGTSLFGDDDGGEHARVLLRRLVAKTASFVSSLEI